MVGRHAPFGVAERISSLSKLAINHKRLTGLSAFSFATSHKARKRTSKCILPRVEFHPGFLLLSNVRPKLLRDHKCLTTSLGKPGFGPKLIPIPRDGLKVDKTRTIFGTNNCPYFYRQEPS